MTEIIELNNPAAAQIYLLQGLCLQRILPARALSPSLEWVLEMSSQGMPLPPPGLVADLGHMAFGMDWENREARALPPLPGVPSDLTRMYEDYVIAKAAADWAFQRAGEALRQYQGRDRARGLAFLMNQFREKAGFGGVELSPAWIKGLFESSDQQLLAGAAEATRRESLHPLIESQLREVVACSRRTSEMLSEVDVFELEQRTALDDFGQRLALRQVLMAAEGFEKGVPQHRPRPMATRQEVPTRILDEDSYPVGGYTSLSNRGSVESLLHSQLAYMEKEGRPDLFDVKFLRDELLYYSRDENQFFRRRRTFAFVLSPDLVHARFKDAGLPFQRIILVLALIKVVIRRLTEWLSTDALKFVVYFVAPHAKDEDESVSPLEDERKLLETLERAAIANQTVEVRYQAKESAGQSARTLTEAAVVSDLEHLARRSLVHTLVVATKAVHHWPEDFSVTNLTVNEPRPVLKPIRELEILPSSDQPIESWYEVVRDLLQRWI